MTALTTYRTRGQLCIIFVAMSIATGANGQIVDDSGITVPPRPPRASTVRSAFTRDRFVAVRDRSFPGFAAQPVVIAGLDLFPALNVMSIATSNVFANNQDRHSDLAVMIAPEAAIRNRGGPVDVTLYGKARFTRFSKFKSEDTDEQSGGIELEAPIGPLSSLSGGASIARRILPRSAPDSPTDANKPLKYREAEAYVGGTIEGGRTRIVTRIDLRQLRFHDYVSTAGNTVLARDRDRDTRSGIIRVERALKSNFSVYVAGTANWVDYRLAPPTVPQQRDSKGWGIYAGSSFELTSLMRGDVRVGKMRQTFKSGVRPISGLGLKGQLQYFPTRLTTVTLNGERAVRDSGVPGASGVIHSGGEVRIDHELRRYFTVSLLAGRFRDKYRGQDRLDHETYAAVTAKLLGKRRWHADLGYQFSRRYIMGPVGRPDFDEHRVMAGITFQY